MRPRFDRSLWNLLALVSAGAVVTSIVATQWFALEPCYLCIFQRTLFVALAFLAALALMRGMLGSLFGALFVVGAALGTFVGGYQSWLQMAAADPAACVATPMGSIEQLILTPIEQLVEWLNVQVPGLFQATGFCTDESLIVYQLSLANWAAVGFFCCFLLAFWGMRRRMRS